MRSISMLIALALNVIVLCMPWDTTNYSKLFIFGDALLSLSLGASATTFVFNNIYQE